MAPTELNAEFNTERRFVRITGERSDGFVEFDFAIGEPELFVELLLSRPAFEEFCAHNHAELLTAEPPHTADDGNPDDLHWRLADVVPGSPTPATEPQQRS
ncbi:phenol hydroxylase subunit [Granulicoccus phenolivorans]|uniref:phenol hydroxylase subunit n=1 Tax=Granulicoccus phenolivorans TaxID=266854 RepID=UPI0003FDD0DA|nr:phenol hydroxylase subunit [Granulicoccus phenolivorans]